MKLTNILLLILVGLVTFSCGEPDYPEPVPSVVAQTGRLYAINTVAGGAALDVTVDNVSATPGPLVNDLAYGQSVGYKNVSAGPNRLVEFLDATDASLKFADRFTVVATTSYTSFYYTTNPANASAVRRVTDVLTTPDVGFAHLRFFNFSKDVSINKVKVTTVGGGTVIFPSRAYAEAISSGAFFPFAAGSYDLEVRDDVSNTVLFTIPTQNFQSKKIYTIYLRGLVGNATLAATIIANN